jgi:hypothetical protein
MDPNDETPSGLCSYCREPLDECYCDGEGYARALEDCVRQILAAAKGDERLWGKLVRGDDPAALIPGDLVAPANSLRDWLWARKRYA